MGTEELLVAVLSGDVPLIHEILDGGVDPNGVDKRCGHSALYNAVRTDKLNVINTLLQRGADPNLRLNYRSFVDGRTESGVVALMYVVSVDATEALVQAGADVNVADRFGITSLMRASHRAKDEVVQCLLAAGADPSSRSQNGNTAADIARNQIAEYESWVVGRDRTPIAAKVDRLNRILSMLERLPE